MGLFNKLFGKKEELGNLQEVAISSTGVTINEFAFTFPIALSAWKDFLGEPTLFKGETNNIYTWHDWGIYGYSTDDKTITSIGILLLKERETQFYPKHIFSGTLKIDGIEYNKYITIAEDDRILKELVFGNLKLVVQITGQNPKRIWNMFVVPATLVQPTVEDKRKYQHQPASEKGIKFADFNFKLLVIEELMYNQELLKPRFDVYEFARLYDKRIIDIDKEGYELIPEVVDYFEKLEIPQTLAHKITNLYQDGGNRIYLELCPFWDGEDNRFDITSYEDTDLFPNLKTMTLFTSDSKVLKELEAKGIRAETL